MDRRKFADLSLKIGVAAAAVSAVPGVLTLRGKARSAATSAVAEGDRLVFATGQNAGQPVSRGSFSQNEAVIAYPENKTDNHENLILVCKLDPSQVQGEGAVEGIVAYSAICTHLGCTVRFAEEPMDAAPFPHIHCPCHQALFDPHRNGLVMGGPAPRPLPQLPVRLNDAGEVVVAGAFSAPIGVQA